MMTASLKRLTLLLLIAVAALAATGQTHYKSKLWVGARAGASLSNVSFSPSIKQSMLTGATASVTCRYVEEKLFGLVAEFGITQRGWKENYQDQPFEYSRTLTYVKLPVMTHIYFGSQRFKCFINLGPEFGFLLGQSTKSNFDYAHASTVPGFPRNRRTEQLTTEVRNRFDYGIVAGAGCELYVKRNHSVVIEGRYCYGLGNIFPASKADTFSASRNNSIEVTIGYNFRLR